MRGAVVTGLIGFAGLLGLAWLAGGSLAFPSDAMATLSGYVAFAPSAVGAVLAALVAAVLTVVVAAALEATLAPWEGRESIAPEGWFTRRWFAVLVAGFGVFLISASAVSGGWLLGTLGVAAVLLALVRGRMPSNAQDVPEVVTADSN